MKKFILFLAISCHSIFCFSQGLTINIQENHFGIDENNLMILSHIENIENYMNITGYSEVIITFNQNNYYFNSVPSGLKYSDSYLITDVDSSQQYTLYFTQLPIVFVASSTTIVDEPKVLANFIYSDNEQVLISNIGIEIRGGSSQAYPKKTYDLEFWGDATGNVTQNVQFGDLRSDDDWILDALYNEPLRMRSYIANRLWREMHVPYYLNDEPEAYSGANVKYVEMFLNGQYNGIYNLSEQVDKKQLQIKSYKEEIRGELYKGISWGASTFISLPDYNNNDRIWSGYEIKYPKEDQITDWSNLYQFTDFVMNSSDSDFINNIWTKFNKENYSDYFLFLNLIRATDNAGKNIYLVKYKANEPYFYVPWDLDGCFGTIWDGTNEDITTDIISNGFINRVIDLNPDDITSSISNKWVDYRNTVFKYETLSNIMLNQYDFLHDNKIYERESLVYPNYSFNQQDLSYMLSWLDNRLDFLDIYFENTLSYNKKDVIKKEVFLFPNPSSDRIYVGNGDSLLQKEYKIYDYLGKLNSKGIIENNLILVNNLENGYYLISLDNITYKLIIK